MDSGRARPLWLALLFALALSLLGIAWRVLGDGAASQPVVIPMGMAVDRSVESETAALLREPVGDVRRGSRRVPGPEEARLVGSLAPAVPVGWTFQFSIDRSALPPLPSHFTSANGGALPYYAALFLGTGGSIEFSRNELPASEPVSLTTRHTELAPLLDGASFVLATSPDGLGSAPAVYFERRHGRAGIHLADAVAIDTGARIVDLGCLVLEPAAYLGTLRVNPREDGDEFLAYVSSKPLESGPLARFGRPLPGRLKSFSSDGGEVQAYSFGLGTRWSVLFKHEDGDLLERVEAGRGEAITIEWDWPQGVSVTIDLERYGSASRVVLVRRDVPSAARLRDAEYAARLEAAIVTGTIPIPRFRTGTEPFNAEFKGLEDGPLRVELWGRSGAEGDLLEWELLHSQDASVAGDVAQVSF